MTAVEPLCLLIGINPKNLSKEELQLLEGELYRRVCEELKEILRHQRKHYFDLMKFTKIEEDKMLEENFLQTIIFQIISSKEYDLEGIARYADIHEDVINELANGLNTRPSAICFRKIIELDRLVRRELYQEIGNKIAAELINNFINNSSLTLT